ncbi:MAG: short-subunit dehydrogenase [Planctomycetota bacterium]|jgi:short-subunit dehydrogenase
MTHFKNAFITGASSGIGQAMALELSRRGTRVVLAARRLDRLQGLARTIRAAGGEAEICELDVTDSKAVFGSIAHWDESVGGLDLVIANAGVGSVGPASKLAWGDVQDVVQVNFVGAIATLLAGKDVMISRGKGTLVGVSSLAGVRAMPESGAYSATKAGLQNFLETLELDLRHLGLRVVDIQPGFVRSEMTEDIEFKMPFFMEVDDCAVRCIDGIEAGRSVISFPWQLAWPLRMFGRIVPRAFWRVLARGMKP